MVDTTHEQPPRETRYMTISERLDAIAGNTRKIIRILFHICDDLMPGHSGITDILTEIRLEMEKEMDEEALF